MPSPVLGPATEQDLAETGALLGEILVRHHGVSTQDIDRALKFQETYGGRLGSILVNMGLISEDDLAGALSRQLAIPLLDESSDSPDFQALVLPEALNVAFLSRRQWLPLAADNGRLTLAAVDPLDIEARQYLRDLGLEHELRLLTEARFREMQGEYELAVQSHPGEGLEDMDLSEAEVDKLRELALEAPIVKLVNRLLTMAVTRQASDLHIEPYKNMYRVRLRIDGLLQDVDFLPLKMQLPIVSRIKILAGMDIAERRRPQDGQISLKAASKELDIRVSTLPLAEGESLVLRFLIKESIRYELDFLGLAPDLEARLGEDIRKSSGVILLTGPTGSGKTTTLYSCLNAINNENNKIITIEDPVEYRLEGVNQIQVHPEIGYDFLHALRSILRQDPDIIMIGEIRDAETARTAMQSSLTGHLVFSTLHTNDAPTAYTRLIDLGVEEYLINSSLISVIAQRLVRKLCPRCAEPESLDPALARIHGLDEVAGLAGLDRPAPRAARGCAACNQTGYRGRVGILEYLPCTHEVKMLPKDGSFTVKAREYMGRAGIRSLTQDGFLKYLRGVTSLQEVLRVAG